MTPKQLELKHLSEILKKARSEHRVRFQNQYFNAECGDYCLSYDTIEKAIEAMGEDCIKTVITVEVI